MRDSNRWLTVKKRDNVIRTVRTEREIFPSLVCIPTIGWQCLSFLLLVLKRCIILLGAVKYLLSFLVQCGSVTVCLYVWWDPLRLKVLYNRGLFYDLLLQVEICKCGNSLMLYQCIHLGNKNVLFFPFRSNIIYTLKKIPNQFLFLNEETQWKKKIPLMQYFSWKFNDTKGRQFKVTVPTATVTLLYSTFRHRFHSMYCNTKYSTLGMQGGRVMVAMGTMTLNFQIFWEFKFSTRTSH